MPFVPAREIPVDIARRIDCVLADIDDTISFDGRIPAAAFGALWRLHDAGLRVVPVTGRPAGWVDHIARMWPVDGVVGENGGFFFHMEDHGLRKVFVQPEHERRTHRKRLEAVRDRILAEVPGCALASDQRYRELDLAIDFCEDVPRLDKAAVQHIVRLFEEAGCQCKVSSIHVNGWYGAFDKLTTTKSLALECFGDDLEDAAVRSRYLFVGDSPNDEPMFRFFENACGVHNVIDFVGEIEHLPRYLASLRGGHGFAELVEALLSARSAP